MIVCSISGSHIEEDHVRSCSWRIVRFSEVLPDKWKLLLFFTE